MEWMPIMLEWAGLRMNLFAVSKSYVHENSTLFSNDISVRIQRALVG